MIKGALLSTYRESFRSLRSQRSLGSIGKQHIFLFSTENKETKQGQESQNNTDKSQQDQTQQKAEQQEQQQQTEDLNEKRAKEAALRKKLTEDKEIAAYRESIEKSNTSFSTLSQLMKLLRGRLILAGLLLGCGIGFYQIYDITEKYVDQFDGKKKILPISREYERKLSGVIAEIFLSENKIINSKKLQNKLSKVIALFQRYEPLGLQVKGKVYIINRQDMMFFMLPNGDLFISKRVALDLNQEELCILLSYELAHEHLRTSAQNFKFSELSTFAWMKFLGFQSAFNQFVPIQQLRQYYTLPLTAEQEANSMVMAADLLEELGMEIDPESLRLFLGDIIGKFNSSNANYILDFRKKHAHI